tara:strand:+ start:2645 stop:3901 length:1257 start_codon:yes stop_codon:yes gene_type:complete
MKITASKFSNFKNLLTNKKRNFLIITQIFNSIIALVCGKLIAEYISPEQFGLYNLQFAAFTFFFSLLIGPSINFLKASYHNLLPEVGYKPFLNLLGLSAVILYIALIVFLNLYKAGEFKDWYLYLILLFLIPFNITSSILSDQFNVLDKIKSFSVFNIIKAISGLIFLLAAFFLLPKFTNDYISLWCMQLVIGATGIFFFLPKIKKYRENVPTDVIKFFLKKYIPFVGPLMFLAGWSWINSFFDRYVLEHSLGIETVGIYSANYSLGSKFFLMLSPIFMVLLTPLIYSNSEISRKKSYIFKYSISYLIIGGLILLVIFFSTDIIGRILLSENYSKGFYMIFWIALSYMIITFTYLFEMIFFANHNTKIILYSNIISAVLNGTLNLILIPLIGMNGAILSLLISVLSRFAFIYFKYKKL